jgi:hypothetical protein
MTVASVRRRRRIGSRLRRKTSSAAFRRRTRHSSRSQRPGSVGSHITPGSAPHRPLDVRAIRPQKVASPREPMFAGDPHGPTVHIGPRSAQARTRVLVSTAIPTRLKTSSQCCCFTAAAKIVGSSSQRPATSGQRPAASGQRAAGSGQRAAGKLTSRQSIVDSSLEKWPQP